jgi:hypothetical protein
MKKAMILLVVGSFIALAIISMVKSDKHVIVSKVYTDQEMKTFWAEHLEGVIVKMINSRHHFSTINSRTEELGRLIQERYQRQFEVKMITTYHPASRMIFAGNWVKDGVPIIELYIPTFIDIHTELINEHGPNQGEIIFGNGLAVGFIHELDHLAYGYVSDSSVDLEKLVDGERQTWALTCELTIRPLINQYQAKLGPDKDIYYSNWIKADRNADNPIWIDFIHRAYSQTRK